MKSFLAELGTAFTPGDLLEVPVFEFTTAQGSPHYRQQLVTRSALPNG